MFDPNLKTYAPIMRTASEDLEIARETGTITHIKTFRNGDILVKCEVYGNIGKIRIPAHMVTRYV